MNVIIVVDVLNGFCVSGNLAIKRLARVVPGIRTYLAHELAAGSKPIFLADTHVADDPEFAMFPPHCVAGSGEEEIVAELQPFAQQAPVVRKTRFSGFYRTNLADLLLDLHPATVEVVGVCTDICVLHTVADLRNRDYPVVVHRDLVETYDAPGHDADQINRWALAHMRDILGARIN
ncbi:MAG: cysteine hydrolase family protein [Thermoleophilia bacterium]